MVFGNKQKCLPILVRILVLITMIDLKRNTSIVSHAQNSAIFIRLNHRPKNNLGAKMKSFFDKKSWANFLVKIC